MTPVECIIPNESAPLCPKGSDVVFLELQPLSWCANMCVCMCMQDNERIDGEGRGYSTLVPSDLALMRFNTRAIITRYRYNGPALLGASVFCNARARERKTIRLQGDPKYKNKISIFNEDFTWDTEIRCFIFLSGKFSKLEETTPNLVYRPI